VLSDVKRPEHFLSDVDRVPSLLCLDKVFVVIAWKGNVDKDERNQREQRGNRAILLPITPASEQQRRRVSINYFKVQHGHDAATKQIHSVTTN
jgi:hypothetical protein